MILHEYSGLTSVPASKFLPMPMTWGMTLQYELSCQPPQRQLEGEDLGPNDWQVQKRPSLAFTYVPDRDVAIGKNKYQTC
jgi:hypothetical protein